MNKSTRNSRSKQAEVVTGLTSIKPKTQVDTFQLDSESKTERVSPDRCFLFRTWNEEVSNIDEFHRFHRKYISSKNACTSRYSVREEIRKDTAVVPRLHPAPASPATMEDRGCRWMVLDVYVSRPSDIAPPGGADDMARFNREVERYVRSRLPSALRDVTSSCQWRSNAGMDSWEHLPLRLLFFVDKPLKTKAIVRWARANDGDGILDASKNSSLYIPIGSPIFKMGVEDPTFGRRLWLSKGTSDEAHLTIPKTSTKRKTKKKSEPLPSQVAEQLGDLVDASNWISHPLATWIVKQALDKLRDALPHERLDLLLDAAIEAGNRVAGDRLSIEDAYWLLAGAAEQWQLPPDESEDTIVEGLHAGAAEPKDVPVTPKERPARDLLDQLAPWDATEKYMTFPTPEPGVYLLRCDLGTGKTEQMARLAIQIMRDGGSVLVIVHRRTLALAMAGRFKMSCYLEELEEAAKTSRPYKIEGSAVISVDSIWRVVPADYDLIVIEESESVFQHFFSGTLPRTDGNGRRSSGTCWAHLTMLCRRCLTAGGTVIGADALASPLSVSGLETLCESGVDRSVQVITHQLSRVGTTIYRFGDKNDLIALIIEQARLGKRCYISCTWKSDAEEIARLLSDESIDVRCYTSDTDPKLRADLRDVEEHWATVLIVISSPAVDTGVSYDIDPRFEFVALLAAHTGSRGVGHPSLLQMTARIRGATELNCYVAGRHDQSLDPDEIDAEAIARVEATETYAKRGGWEIGVRGDHEEGHEFMGRQVERHQRCVTFDVAGCFYLWWRLRGALVLRSYPPVSMDQASPSDEVKTALKETRGVIKKETIARQAAAPVMSSSEYSDARRQEPRSTEQRDSLRVTELANTVGRDAIKDPKTAEVLLQDDHRNRLTREIRDYAVAGLIWDELWQEATHRDGRTAATGYRAHFEGYSASIHASLLVAEFVLGKEFLSLYFAPPSIGTKDGQHVSYSSMNISDVWTKPPLHEEDYIYDAIRSAASALRLTAHDLERCGARMAPGGYCKFVGTHLRHLGLQTTLKRPRKGIRRTTEYSVDLDKAECTQRLAAVQCARVRGWTIRALDPEFAGTEWQVAVRDGRWVMKPDGGPDDEPPKPGGSRPRSTPRSRPDDQANCVHVLRSLDRLAAKSWSLGPDGEPESRAFDKALIFSSEEILVDGIRGLSRVLLSLEDDLHAFVIRGRRMAHVAAAKYIRRISKNKPDSKAMIEDCPRRWLCLDIDDLPCPSWLDPEDDPVAAARYVRDYLADRAPELRDVTMHIQWSASAGVHGWHVLRVHAWVCLVEPVGQPELEAWFDAAGYGKLVDRRLAHPTQPHYTARPRFDVVEDPLPGHARSGLLPGLHDEARLCIPNNAATRTRRQASSTTAPDGYTPPASLDELRARSPESSDPYAAAALRSECSRLAATAPGGRHTSAYRAAAVAGAFVAGGALVFDDAWESLTSACEACGLADDPDEDIETTLTDGLLAGALKPRTTPNSATPEERSFKEEA